MRQFLSRHVALIFIILCFLVLGTLTILSEGFYGGTDNVSHYFIARYAFDNPALFFNSWGRPLYTILASPFALLGFGWMKFFNLILGILTAWFSYKIAKKLGLRPAFLVIILVLFTPLYIIMLPTTLTEVLFSFVLILAIYFFFEERFLLSTVVISFIPFARTEGIILIPVFIIAILLKRKFRVVPFFLTGFAVLSIAGNFVYHDLLWIIHNPAYPIHHPIYHTHGPLFHFVLNRYYIFGSVMEILFVAGMIVLIYRCFSGDRKERVQAWWEFWMILLPFVLYFAFHSFLYWKALGGSIGLIRVLAGVLPLASIVSLMTVDAGERTIEGIFPGGRWRAGYYGFVILIVIIAGFGVGRLPTPIGIEESYIKTATQWMHEQGVDTTRVFYTDSNVPFYLGLNPYDPKECSQVWALRATREMPVGSAFVWDAHFGPNESQVPLDTILSDGGLMLLNIIRPDEVRLTFGGAPYEIYIFRKLPGNIRVNNFQRKDSILEAPVNNKPWKTIFSTSFEPGQPDYIPNRITSDTADSGYALRLSHGYPYGAAFGTTAGDFGIMERGKWVRVSFHFYPEIPFREKTVFLVSSLQNADKAYYYQAEDLWRRKPVPGQWNDMAIRVAIPPAADPRDVVKVYFFCLGNSTAYLDDVKMESIDRNKN
jgi:hypothetical protein